MGRPRFRPIRNTLAAIALVGAMILTLAAPVAATPWQRASGDYDSHQQWHDANCGLQNRHDWVTAQHPEWTENYGKTCGPIGDSDRMNVWHYGDGGFDRSNAVPTSAARNEARTPRVVSSTKPDGSVKNAPNLLANI